MTAKDAIEKITSLLSLSKEVEITMAMLKLLDGGTIEVSEMIVGGTTSAADGEYELEDNTMVKVEGGVITEISAPEVESPEVEVTVETPMAEETPVTLSVEEEIVALKSEIDSMKQMINDLQSCIKPIEQVEQEKVEIEQTKQEEIEVLKEQIEELKDEPAAEPITSKRVEVVSNEPLTLAQRLKNLNKK